MCVYKQLHATMSASAIDVIVDFPAAVAAVSPSADTPETGFSESKQGVSEAEEAEEAATLQALAQVYEMELGDKMCFDMHVTLRSRRCATVNVEGPMEAFIRGLLGLRKDAVFVYQCTDYNGLLIEVMPRIHRSVLGDHNVDADLDADDHMRWQAFQALQAASAMSSSTSGAHATGAHAEHQLWLWSL